MTVIPFRTLVVLCIDVAVSALAFVGTYVLIHGIKQLNLAHLADPALLLAAITGLTFPAYGVYRNLWRYVSIIDLSLLLQASVFALCLFYGLWWSLDLPRISPSSTYPFIHFMVMILALGGARILRRAFADPKLLRKMLMAKPSNAGRTILLVAAPDQAELFIRSQGVLPSDMAFHVIGICDPRGEAVGRAIHGVPVLGNMAQLETVLENLAQRPARLGVAADAFDRLPENFDAICATYGLSLGQLPEQGELQQRVEAARILKPIAIEDILGRTQHVIDLAPVRDLLAGKTVLVTGAGGSIGSEIVRQVAGLNPKRLILAEHSEYALYNVDRECHEKFEDLDYVALLADVREADAIDHLFAAHKPEIVFHAAALKHVPIVEAQPAEGIMTNVLGTQIVAQAAQRHGAQAFVMISTDKAVAPLSIMGASKRIAEMLVQDMDRDDRNSTRFLSVRFGNVLGSSGSVVPLFRHQIASGGPVTVTHEEMTRFFMTIREAVGLVLQATVQGLSSPGRGAVYVLDMGRPVKIIDLARQMIRLAGLVPERDIPIKVVGLRPGEKLHEELFCSHEQPVRTALPSVMEAECGTPPQDLAPLLNAARAQDGPAVLSALKELIPDSLIA